MSAVPLACFAEAPEPWFGRGAELPLRLASAAAAVRDAGWRCTLEDAGIHRSFASWSAACLAGPPRLLFVHGDSKHLTLAGRLAGAAKAASPRTFTVLWGNHTDALDREALLALPAVDAVVRHDPEATVAALARRLAVARDDGRPDLAGLRGATWRAEDGALVREADAPRANLDDLALPARELLRPEAYSDFRGPAIGQLFSARGCAYKCTFCEEAETPLALRSPSAVVDEMQGLARDHGVTRFTFRDPLFGPRRHLLAVCREIEARMAGTSFYCLTHPNQVDEETADALLRAGCWCVDMGVESGDPDVLASYRKGSTLESVRRAVSLLRARGMRVQLNLILGGPHDTPASIRRSVSFFLSLRPDHHCVTLVQPVPGSPLHAELAASGRLRTPPRWDDYYTSPFYTLRDGLPDFATPPRLDRMVALAPEVIAELERAYRRLGRRMVAVRVADAAKQLATGALLRRPGGPARLLRDAARAAQLVLR